MFLIRIVFFTPRPYTSLRTWLLGVFAFLFSVSFVHAQSFNGVSQSSYGALNQLYQNPAAIINSKNRMEFKIAQGDLSIINNYYDFNPVWNAPFQSFINQNDSNLFRQLQTLSTGYKSLDVSQSAFRLNMGADFQLLGFYKQFVRPGKKNFAIAITTRIRSLVNMENLDRNIFKIVDNNTVAGVMADQLNNYVFRMSGLQYSYHKFAEIDLTYSTEIFKNKFGIFSGGVTLKRLMGIYHEGFRSNNLSLQFKAPPYFNVTDLKFSGDIEFHIANKKEAVGLNDYFPIGNLFSANSSGWGGDFGFQYVVLAPPKKIKPNQALAFSTDSLAGRPVSSDCDTRYRVKVSTSIIDFGFVKYGAEQSDNYKLNVQDSAHFLDWNNSLAGRIYSYNSFLSTVFQSSGNLSLEANQTDVVKRAYQQDMSVFLPMKWHIDVDFPLSLKNKSALWSNTYLNIAYNHNLFGVYTLLNDNKVVYGNQVYSHLVASVRYQTKNFDLSFPITTYTQLIPAVPFFNVGIGARYKHFIFGTSNLSSFLSRPTTQNLNIYAGINIIVPYYCPPPPQEDTTQEDLKSGYQYKDTDDDKIPDHKDKCPFLHGEIANFGCPIDPDSLLNRLVANLSGRLKFIHNTNVLQPSSNLVLDSIKGLLKAYPQLQLILSGKPDSSYFEYNFNNQLALSRDSVLRNEMEARGLDATKVLFVAIRPEQPMPSEIPIIRKHISGKDEDRDGVFDSMDRCPTLIGSLKQDGCLFIDEVNNKLLTTALGSKIEFWKGLKNFAYSSEQYLDEVATIMKSEPSARILVRGFVGREILTLDYKYELSQKRADTIKLYLMQRGIAANRIIALGMSPYEPYNSVPILFSITGRENMDTDLDRVLDTLDRCPTLKGLAADDGCPTASELEKYRYVDSLSQLVEFETDKDVIKTSSLPALLALYRFMVSNPLKTIAISPGVVSTTLTNEQKDALSQMRSLKIKNYLETLGVNPDRLIARGLGYQQPLSAVNVFTLITSRLIDGDQDDVKDYEDKCPTVRGTVSNYGCPQVNDEDLDLLARINRNLIFEPNKSILKPESAIYLDSLVWFMAYNPNTTIIVSGNVANPDLKLETQDRINQERADLIRNFLMVSGVSKNRVTAVGLSHLEQKPWLTPSARVADNLTDIDNDITKDVYDKCPNTPGSTFNHGCPYRLDKINDKLASISKKLLFDLNEYELKPQIAKELKGLVKMLNQDTTLVIILSGHADSTGGKEYNENLSLKRARSVFEFIVKNSTINPSRMIVIGLGDKLPIADNKTIHGREQNRRVSIFLIE